MDTEVNKTNNLFQSSNQNQTTDYQALAQLAGKLILLSTVVTNSTQQDNVLILSTIISLIGGAMLIRSAYLESNEQQIAPGQTTFANTLKVIGTTGSLTFSFLLFLALLIETSIKQQTTIRGQTPLAGVAGALFL
ncbi:MAG: hypothetical protein Q8936_06855 [Bacillota bacterium]|nr:hypothetical protein [Bacillota bacterium]